MINESLWELKNIDSRCITAENPTGEKGKGAMCEPWPGHVGEHLGKGWKIRPCVGIKAGEDLYCRRVTDRLCKAHLDDSRI